MTEKKSSPALWIAAGCGLLLLFGCCASGVVGFFFYRQQEQQAIFEPTDPFASDGPVTAPGLPPTPLIISAAPRPTSSGFTVIASVERVAGTIPVSVGDSCAFRVEIAENGQAPMGYWCHAMAACNGTLLYGGPSNGFFPCAAFDSPPAIVGEDAETTVADQDGSFQLETQRGTLIIRDDASGHLGAFRVEARVMSVL